MMLLLLRELGAEGPVATLAEAVGMEHDGKSLCCRSLESKTVRVLKDDLSGKTTRFRLYL